MGSQNKVDTESSTENKQSYNIALSAITQKLIKANQAVKFSRYTDDYTRIHVSPAVSFLALVYEKIRNAIEDREDHLIRRAAIARILKRLLGMNPSGKGEGENLLRELLWARYFPNDSLGQQEVSTVQNIIDTYLGAKRKLIPGRNPLTLQYISSCLFDLLTCEIEEALNAGVAMQESIFEYYIFQILRNKVKIEELSPQQKDTLLFVALENAYRKSDRAYARYHLFCLFYQPLAKYSKQDLDKVVPKLPDILKKVDEMIENPTILRLTKFVKRQLPPFLILFEVLRNKPYEITKILTNKADLWNEVSETCKLKYIQIKKRLNILAIRSLIYVFITKIIFALIIEVPISKILFNEVHYGAVAINSIASPILMILILLTVTLPGEDNTKRIYQRIVDIVDADPSFEQSVALITRKLRQQSSFLIFIFTIIYTLTFVITLSIIYELLSMIDFNMLSTGLFIFFISVISFFSYRIKQVANEYKLVRKESILSPVVDFFFMPILSLGKVFSEGVSQLNFFTIIFDFIIEAPFKLIIEVIEEWISFVRARKDEIM